MATPSDNIQSQSDAQNGSSKIQVLLVDDSAVIRGALARILENFDDVEIVSSVANGEMAISSARRKQPDIIIMDIEMPVMDGITALPEVLKTSPNSKVIMFSSLTEEGADVTLKALSLGAVECIVKPCSSEPIGEGSLFQRKLIETIRGLVPKKARSGATLSAVPEKTEESFSLRKDAMAYTGKPSLIMIGSSTGGPQALFEVLKNIGTPDIPIVVTQHMPAKFTTMLAQHIQQHSSIPSFEGTEGMAVEKGKIYVAPGGYHMKLVQDETFKTIIKLDEGPPIHYCKPSVEPMFTSALEIYGRKALGVMLTGMGNDGINSSKDLVEKGGRLIAQDEKTSVVWGMPGAVAKAGLCADVLPLNEIGPWIRKALAG
ncbi:MAG: chemotaxis response regulator protein-glutamate methylesterase [Alphaproteobacteria bacterium]|nr:chemotaxis response regulator protein-glutamate methylesterase [Alphaproteobacteria bacterium]